MIPKTYGHCEPRMQFLFSGRDAKFNVMTQSTDGPCGSREPRGKRQILPHSLPSECYRRAFEAQWDLVRSEGKGPASGKRARMDT